MARLLRPLRQWPLMQHSSCSHTTFHHPILSATKSSSSLSLATSLSCNRGLHFPSRALKPRTAPKTSDFDESGSNSSSDSDSDATKSRNQKKREAKRAVRWGMELASFSAPQIKRILRMASIEREVYDALMLAKRLGPDVREGKRRQFNYIGKLLREVNPELMDALIHSTKDGEWSRAAVPGSENVTIEDGDEDSEETEYEEEEEDSQEYVNVATRWLDGLVSKDIRITNEVYAISSIDFDRQELRKLVRRVHQIQDRNDITEENEQEVEAAISTAKKPLACFLHTLAKQVPTESICNGL